MDPARARAAADLLGLSDDAAAFHQRRRAAARGHDARAGQRRAGDDRSEPRRRRRPARCPMERDGAADRRRAHRSDAAALGVRAARCRIVCAAHRVRERGGTAARPGADARARNGRAARDRFEPRPARAAAPHRSAAARGRVRGLRRSARGVGRRGLRPRVAGNHRVGAQRPRGSSRRLPRRRWTCASCCSRC